MSEQPTKELHHPDGTLRMECCPKCQRDRVQAVKRVDEGYDNTLDKYIFVFTQFCPDCWAWFDRRVDGETASLYHNFMHNRTVELKFEIQDYEKFFKQLDFSEFAIWIDKFIGALAADHIVSEDF